MGGSTGNTWEGGASHSSETYYTFDGNGNVQTNSSSYVSAYTGSNTHENVAGSATSSSNTPYTYATYKLLGQDTLVVTWPNGQTTSYHVEIFNNGMKINGQTLIKK